MDCLCVPLRGGMGKTKAWSAFEWGMVVGTRHTGLSVKNEHSWVIHPQQFPVYIKNLSPPKGHPANLTTVGSIGVNMDQHPCGMNSTPCRVQALTNWGCTEGKRGCNSILGRYWSCFFYTQCICVYVKNPAALQFLTQTGVPCHLLPYPIQRHFNLLSCPFTL